MSAQPAVPSHPTDRVQLVPHNNALLDRLSALRNLPPDIVALTAFIATAGPIAGGMLGWPLWAMIVVAVLPWLPLLTGQLAWTYRHYQWLALFALLVVSQTGHFFEHVAQMVQIHLLGAQGPAAGGIIGPLNTEWVHFVWNTWVVLAVLVLLRRYPANAWLWATLLLSGWHAIEHFYIMSVYLKTGLAGTPGLLARGGAIGGGLPLIRPDLHFLR